MFKIVPFKPSVWYLDAIQDFPYTKWQCLQVHYSSTVVCIVYSRMFFRSFYRAITVRFFNKYFDIKKFYLLTQYKFLHSLALIRESGIQDRIIKQFDVLNEPEEQPSTIDVGIVTLAPILVVLVVAGYVIGMLLLLIERCVHGNILKCWPRGSVRRWWQNDYWRLLYN